MERSAYSRDAGADERFAAAVPGSPNGSALASGGADARLLPLEVRAVVLELVMFPDGARQLSQVPPRFLTGGTWENLPNLLRLFPSFLSVPLSYYPHVEPASGIPHAEDR
jgi:hypothetical protein